MIHPSYTSDGRLMIAVEGATEVLIAEGDVQPPSYATGARITWEVLGTQGPYLPGEARDLGVALIRLGENADHVNARHFGEAQ